MKPRNRQINRVAWPTRESPGYRQKVRLSRQTIIRQTLGVNRRTLELA
jgi:hypothetical protein